LPSYLYSGSPAALTDLGCSGACPPQIWLHRGGEKGAIAGRPIRAHAATQGWREEAAPSSAGACCCAGEERASRAAEAHYRAREERGSRAATRLSSLVCDGGERELRRHNRCRTAMLPWERGGGTTTTLGWRREAKPLGIGSLGRIWVLTQICVFSGTC
jgi:hypothetical protein